MFNLGQVRNLFKFASRTSPEMPRRPAEYFVKEFELVPDLLRRSETNAVFVEGGVSERTLAALSNHIDKLPPERKVPGFDKSLTAIEIQTATSKFRKELEQYVRRFSSLDKESKNEWLNHILDTVRTHIEMREDRTRLVSLRIEDLYPHQRYHFDQLYKRSICVYAGPRLRWLKRENVEEFSGSSLSIDEYPHELIKKAEKFALRYPEKEQHLAHGTAAFFKGIFEKEKDKPWNAFLHAGPKTVGRRIFLMIDG